STQVVKFRFRRAVDSLDALDFNIVMSPFDVYAGFLSIEDDGDIIWAAEDTTCTVPVTTNGVLQMPDIYRPGAETGYVEIIAMAAAEDEDEAIAIGAKHSGTDADPALTPADCDGVRSNFFANGSVTPSLTVGQVDYNLTVGLDLDGDEIENDYVDSDNPLKVSYFIRDNATGIEFGDNAIHIQDFLENPAMTNQEFGYLSGDLSGFDFPDLDGGSPEASMMGLERGRFNLLRDSEVLGVGSLINEWSANPANGVGLDWVVTMPGQYVMFDVIQYLESLVDEDEDCDRLLEGDDCDYRDIPVTAAVDPYNREETEPTDPAGRLVVSPQLPGVRVVTELPNETNVITFAGNSVLGVSDVNIDADLGQPFGWLSLAVSSADENVRICDWGRVSSGPTAGAPELTCTTSATGAVPMIGFAAWQRSVAANPDASYGRIVAHSFTS
ncbi:MAG: hypothetical protein AAF583_16325, partial [Pseudomonadota bacterium]